MKELKTISRILVIASSLAMVTAYFVPLWQILMWAPQYPEGLGMKIWINNITGDVRIISALNHYIGMRHIEVDMFPEFGYMIYIAGFLIGFGLLTAIINRRFMLITFAGLIIAFGIAALVDFYLWGYDYGHNLDPNAPIIVPGMSYQPPLIGTKQLLNFTAYSGPDVGGWIFLVAGLTTLATVLLELNKINIMKTRLATALSLVFILSLEACSTEPEPLEYGKDACRHCKMILMDKRFGSEIVTHKGKTFKFDDLNCMLSFYNGTELIQSDVKDLLIVDFSHPGKLIDARNAWYVRSEEIKSPMASNVAAFESNAELKAMNKEWSGIIQSWGEIQTQFK